MTTQLIQGSCPTAILPEKLRKEDEEYTRIELKVKEGVILSLEPLSEVPEKKRLILPLLFNAHTHLGDSFIRRYYKKEELPRDILSLVSPPHGLKHRMLKMAHEEEVIEGIVQSFHFAWSNGVVGLVDFREGGVRGLKIFKKAYLRFSTYLNKSVEGTPLRRFHPFVLGRPESKHFDRKEMAALLQNSDGINISSISDLQQDYICEIANFVKRYNMKMASGEKKKRFALHASERLREDVDFIISLRPDFVVHFTKASQSDMRKLAEEHIPVVVCPSSNIFFGFEPPFKKMLKSALTLALGSDNAMLQPPSLLQEMKIILERFQLPTHFVLKMALLFKDIYTMSKGDVKDLRRKFGYIYKGSKEGFMVLEGAERIEEFESNRCNVKIF